MAATIPTEKSREAQPVSILDSGPARLYTHVHPLFVLSGYILNFKSIVAEPVPSLVSLLLPLGIAHTLYAVICLPPTGSSTPIKSAPGSRKKNVATGIGIPKRISTAILSLLLTLLLGAPLVTLLLILFGAPMSTHVPHTFLCAAHIALLSAFPLIYVHGVDTHSWRSVAALMLPADEVFGAAVGTLFGAWIGAVPIPLDWDREWQQWPITIVTGAYAGWVLGKFLGSQVFKGKVIDLSG